MIYRVCICDDCVLTLPCHAAAARTSLVDVVVVFEVSSVTEFAFVYVIASKTTGHAELRRPMPHTSWTIEGNCSLIWKIKLQIPC